MTAWGFHLLLDCTAGEIARVNSRENISKFIKELVIAIDMKAYGEPWIERFATHDATKSGFSFCQMIETSNITGHFVETNGNFYIDVFSCKPYSYNTVVEMVQDFFKPQKITQQIILRDA
jgi:S-adenosylmethionine/arginine decarboxylase-like enzyme